MVFMCKAEMLLAATPSRYLAINITGMAGKALLATLE
jgi:hypothetical protein